MSNWTYLCEKCGSVRRLPMSREGRSRYGAPLTMPRCCARRMWHITKAHAEAATKLTRDDRLRWIRRGMHVFRRPGRRWTAALTPRQIAAAKDQFASFLASD